MCIDNQYTCISYNLSFMYYKQAVKLDDSCIHVCRQVLLNNTQSEILLLGHYHGGELKEETTFNQINTQNKMCVNSHTSVIQNKSC